MSKDVKKVDMTVEDQTNINAFNKLNSQMHEVEAQISVKKKLLEELEDASNELMLCDEEAVRYVLGECFVYMDKDSAEERLQSTTDLLKQEAADHNQELQGIKEQMQKLKAALYGKFGRNINLEE